MIELFYMEGELLSLNLNAVLALIKNADIALVELALIESFLFLEKLNGKESTCSKNCNGSDYDTDDKTPVYTLLCFHDFVLLWQMI